MLDGVAVEVAMAEEDVKVLRMATLRECVGGTHQRERVWGLSWLINMFRDVSEGH